jgi:transcriptional regulator with XRE-family HTH domain
MKPAELKRIRTELLGRTQEELAEDLGVHRVTIAKWEAGDRGIPEPVAKLLIRILADKKPKRKAPAPDREIGAELKQFHLVAQEMESAIDRLRASAKRAGQEPAR